jgi:hypothetical protein
VLGSFGNGNGVCSGFLGVNLFGVVEGVFAGGFEENAVQNVVF